MAALEDVTDVTASCPSEDVADAGWSAVPSLAEDVAAAALGSAGLGSSDPDSAGLGSSDPDSAGLGSSDFGSLVWMERHHSEHCSCSKLFGPSAVVRQ
ncbi:hypothetical protein TcYC6_0004650 [Trypanosoma cruzi]|nr:hypothetical protein TcYC6_0004650 [Trypanosoma cruzi]